MSNKTRREQRHHSQSPPAGAEVVAVGDRVAVTDGSLAGVDPFTPLTVDAVNPDGTLELSSGTKYHRVKPSSVFLV